MLVENLVKINVVILTKWPKFSKILYFKCFFMRRHITWELGFSNRRGTSGKSLQTIRYITFLWSFPNKKRVDLKKVAFHLWCEFSLYPLCNKTPCLDT